MAKHNEIQMLFFCWEEMVLLSSKSILFLNDRIGTAQILCFLEYANHQMIS